MGWLDTNNYTKVDVGKKTIMEPGWYPFELTDFQYLTTRDGKGKRVAAKFICIDATYAGEAIEHNWNVINASEDAVNISRNQIFSIARALDVVLVIDAPSDIVKELEKFTGQPIYCLVETEKGKGTYTSKKTGEEVPRSDRNRIVEFKAYVEGAPEEAKPSLQGRPESLT